MDTFEAIKQHCQANSKFTRVIDDFLIYYAVQKDRLEKKMDQKIKPYKHITKKVQDSYINFLKSEYIASQVLKKNGLLGKYLQHSTIKALPTEEYQYLVYQYKHPWRFSFAQIIERPAKDFFQMLDVFTGEEYLLYSPGMTTTPDQETIHLWFNLIAFNGKCWQTYGLILGFQSFTADDLFFFATELYPQLEDEEDLMRMVEKNPWPFFMLLSRATIPFTQSQGSLLMYHTAMDEVSDLPLQRLKEAFKIRWEEDVYELQLDKWSEPPHFAKAYYDESEGTLFRFAGTEAGFNQLNRSLQEQGIPFDPEPEIKVTPGMLITAEEVLRRKIVLDPYEELFAVEDQAESEELQKLNGLLGRLVPLLNNNEPFDIEQLATEAGVDVGVAKDILEKMKAQMRKLGEKD
jgi:hypothetical protein